MPGYFDIEAILCEEQLVPSVLLCDAAGLGWLDVSSVSEDLVANTRMDLPLWLAQSLSEKNVRDPPTTSGCGCCTPTATLCTFRRTLYGSCFMHSVLPTCGLVVARESGLAHCCFTVCM
jgi:hypothetical protein